MRGNSLTSAFFFLASTALTSVSHAADTLSVSDLNLFRAFTADNDVGTRQGDDLQFGADITGGSAGATIQGKFTPTVGPPIFTTVSPCGPLAVNSEFCGKAVPYTSAVKSETGQVLFTLGALTGTFSLPSAALIPDAPVKLPASVTISANPITGAPTISWTLPAGTDANALRVNIYDKSHLLLNGAADIIESDIIDPKAISFTPSIGLTPGGSYAIGFQVIKTRDGGSDPSNSQADILSDSRSFFDFSPPKPGSPPVIQLPTIDEAGVYHFNVLSVSPDSVTFIDPKIAIGYDYAIGAGDPNFASVILPDVGGGHFELMFELGGKTVTDALNEGVQFFFGDGGVSAFEVAGIDPSAMLDPGNAGAFVTGLTFASAGEFTGTMTPITATTGVPEPSAWVMMLLGFVGLGYAGHRRASGPKALSSI
jgi:PEP-CTERM motif